MATSPSIVIESSDEQILALGTEGGSAESPAMPSQPSQIIHLVEFEFCSGQQCPWESASGVHLLISNHEADLEKKEEINGARAISYAWGEFDRTQRLIGHNTNGEDCFMTLGQEWDIESFTNRLVLLSFEHRACWIDQLCIPQKDAEIRKALASIPTIYRTLGVVALMPGAPCKCLRQSLETFRVAKDFGSGDDYSSVMRSIFRDMDRCLNFFPSSSWFNRIWTRQELLYSKRISVVWTETRDAPCVDMGPGLPPVRGEQTNDDFYLALEQALDPSPLVRGKQMNDDCCLTAEQALGLSPFARLLYQRAAKENYSTMFASSWMSAVKKAFQTSNSSALFSILPGLLTSFADIAISVQPYPNTEAGARLRETAEKSLKYVETLKKRWAKMSDKVGTATLIAVQCNYHHTAFREYISANYFENMDLAFFEFIQFLAGETVERVQDPNLTNEKNPLARFFYSLGYLRASARASTQVRDYVNAVWVDCPNYQIPANYKSMDLPTLLEDALGQLRVNHKVGIATAAPAGLLSSAHGTGLWKPSLYLSKTAIKDAAQVYGPITRPFKPVPVTNDGMIPLRFTDAGYFALSSKADDYEYRFSHFPTEFMFNRMKWIASLWPRMDMYERRRLTPTDQQLAEKTKDLTELEYAGRGVANSISTSVSSFVRYGFGGRGHEDREERSRKSRAEIKTELKSRIKHSKDERDFMDLLKGLSLQRNNDTCEWGSRAEINHSKMVYQLVVDMLGLEYEMCRSRGLRLMISEDPPCIGMSSLNVSIPRAGQRAGETDYDMIRTICITPGEALSGSTLYEVEKVEGNFDPPRYRVFGVWVPFVGECQDRIYATAETGATDGYIV
jgi:hypothetical protein